MIFSRQYVRRSVLGIKKSPSKTGGDFILIAVQNFNFERFPFSRLARIRDNRIACELAEYDRVHDGVSAQAVRTVYAAGNFARRIQARNDFSVGVVHVTARIDFDAAHRVVNRRNAGSRIERRLVDRRRIKRTTERVLRFISDVFVEIVECGFQMICGNVYSFRKLFDGVRFHRAAGRNEFVRGFVEIVFFRRPSDSSANRARSTYSYPADETAPSSSYRA